MSKSESLFFEKTFDNLKDSVVIVEAYLSCFEDPTRVDYNKGLGVIVDANKILTSASIVKNAICCYCRGIGESVEQRFPVKVIDHSFNLDLALLTFESSSRIFKAATIENSYGISYGESVLVIANPQDSDFTLSIGQVACPERYRVWLPNGFEKLQKFHESLLAEEGGFGVSVIQLNNIHSLNYLKGGPVFNFRGHVIGILSYATIYDMAVHLDLIKIFLKRHGFSFVITKKWKPSSDPPQLYESFMEEYNGHYLNEQDKDTFFRKMHQAVVVVRCVSNDLVTATGSGVLVGDGLILTAAHVVCGHSQFLISFKDKSNWEAELISFDDYLDLALLRNKDGFENHPKVTLAERNSIHHGAMALAIGHPSRFSFSYTIGTVVLPTYRTGNFAKEANFYWPVEKCYAVKPKELTSLLFATCNTHFQHGSSGCPVFNTRGQLIGISTHSQNPVDFMVHINEIHDFIHDFMEACKETGMPEKGVEIMESTPLKRKIDEPESKFGKKRRALVLRVAEQVKEVKVLLDHSILVREIQQEAAAQEDVGVKANKCIKIFLVSSKEEVGAKDSFRIVPIDLSHFFDEDGQLFGYKNLKINVFLSTISFHAYADITFESLCDGERGIVNLKSSLQKIFGESLVKEKDDFLKTFSAGTDYIRNVISNGEALQREATKGDSNNKSYKQLEAENFTVEQQVIRMAVNSMAVGELYCRLIPLVLLLVDGCSPIDVTDPRWEIYLAVESKSNDHGVVGIKLLGFAAVNRFYDDTGNSRLRISQILVLPPYQGRGHGRLLLEVINSVAVSENVYDVTVEKPSDYFQHVQTCFDMHRLLDFEPIKHDISSAVLHLNQGNSSKKPFKGQFDPPLTAVEDVRRSLKINKKQFLQCWEILLFLELIHSDSQFMENYITLITDGRRDDMLGKDTALNDFDHEMTSVAVCPRGNVIVDNINAEVEGNQDTQEEQLKQLVGNRLKEIMEIAKKILLNHQ